MMIQCDPLRLDCLRLAVDTRPMKFVDGVAMTDSAAVLAFAQQMYEWASAPMQPEPERQTLKAV